MTIPEDTLDVLAAYWSAYILDFNGDSVQNYQSSSGKNLLDYYNMVDKREEKCRESLVSLCAILRDKGASLYEALNKKVYNTLNLQLFCQRGCDVNGTIRPTPKSRIAWNYDTVFLEKKPHRYPCLYDLVIHPNNGFEEIRGWDCFDCAFNPSGNLLLYVLPNMVCISQYAKHIKPIIVRPINEHQYKNVYPFRCCWISDESFAYCSYPTQRKYREGNEDSFCVPIYVYHIRDTCITLITFFEEWLTAGARVIDLTISRNDMGTPLLVLKCQDDSDGCNRYYSAVYSPLFGLQDYPSVTAMVFESLLLKAYQQKNEHLKDSLKNQICSEQEKRHREILFSFLP
jgi:hypothetical protein